MPKSASQASFEPNSPLELLAQFESLAREVLRLRSQGSAGMEIARAQGAADGFARALLTAGLAEERDLLKAAQSARRGSGPAMRSLQPVESAAELISREASLARSAS